MPASHHIYSPTGFLPIPMTSPTAQAAAAAAAAAANPGSFVPVTLHGKILFFLLKSTHIMVYVHVYEHVHVWNIAVLTL